MSRDLAVRVLAAALLAGALLGMGVHYGGEWEARERYRTTVEAIDADPAAYADRPVYLWLTVDSASDGRIVAQSDRGADSARVVVRAPGAAESASPGDTLQVFGRLRPDCDLSVPCHRVDAERVVVHDGGGQLRMYLVSAAGGLLAVAAFLGRWRFDAGRAAFVPRGGNSEGGEDG